jgi:hypothetical protein
MKYELSLRVRAARVLSTAALLAGAIAVPSAQAAKPVDDSSVPYGNGFPSGAHYNLNLIAKKPGFNCPPPGVDSETGAPSYGNVIYFPREQGADDVTVLMESGTKGPKGAPDTDRLEVTDACTESFPDYGTGIADGASLRLPKNDAGYAVYARVTGKPSKDGAAGVGIGPNLLYVEDETGNDLVLLGLVDRDGVATFHTEGEELLRTDSTRSGKGVRKATDLSGLFAWSGEVCYTQEDVDSYCLDSSGANLCSTFSLCCTDDNMDGVYESCDALSLVGTDGDGDGLLSCPLGTIAVEWVFNIGDFVGYFWTLNATGAYVVQVRFYPL